jgi:START domain
MVDRVKWILMVIAVCWSAVCHGRDVEVDWVPTRSDHGIQSFRASGGRAPLDTFRAETTMAADLWSLLAILEDVDQACSWTAHCAEMRAVRRVGPRELLVYAQMDAPWPVRDRDVVTRVRLELTSLRAVVADIESVTEPTLPARPGIVRMPRMRARYTFLAEGSGRVRVSYEVAVDPGGTLPDWLKNLVARDLAHDTLDRLRQRAAWVEQHGTYRARARELAAIATAELGERVQASP